MEKVIDLKNYKKAVITLGFVMLSVLLPQIFHVFGMNGQIFLPMHIPVLLAGFLLGPIYGFLAGAISPIISTALTGMPAEFPMMPIMIFELGTYGLVSGLLNKYTKLPSFASLVIAMITGRISYAISYGMIKTFMLPTISSNISVQSAFIAGIPGIVIQLIIISIILIIVKKERSKNDE